MGCETASRAERTEGRSPQQEDSLTFKSIAVLILGNSLIYFSYSLCVELAHIQAVLPAGSHLLGPAAPFHLGSVLRWAARMEKWGHRDCLDPFTAARNFQPES